MKAFNVSALVAVAASLGLAGCAGAGVGAPSTVPSQHAPSATEFETNEISRSARRNDIFIAEYDHGAVAIIDNRSWSSDGTITNGITAAGGATVDTSGDLYVVNSPAYGSTTNIQEYAHGRKSPTFTYSTGMTYANRVAVDSAGNVYEADSDGYVRAYAQGSNVVAQSCAVGAPAVAIAIDKSGDVFVAFNVQTKHGTTGSIMEFAGGLSGCNGTTVYGNGFVAGPWGIAADANSNLLVCDYWRGSIDVLAPPYNVRSRILAYGFTAPADITLDKNNKLAFVADLGAQTYGAVDILSYPSGSLIKQLDYQDSGIYNPIAAVYEENAVY